MPQRIPTTLFQALTDRNLITPEQATQIESDTKKAGTDLGRYLVTKEIISDADLATLKSEIYRLPLINLKDIEVDQAALKQIGEDVVNFYQVSAFGQEGNVLKVGITNPEDVEALEALKFVAANKGLTLEKYILSYTDFDTLSRNYRSLSADIGKALESFNDELKKDITPAAGKSLEEITAEAPVTRIVATVIKYAVESRASDIHIEPFEDRVRTRFRVDGILVTALTLPKNLHAAIITRIKILSDLKIDETRLAQDGRFATRLNNRKIDFRVSTFPTKNGEKVVMRILDPLAGNVDLAALGIQGRALEAMERGMDKPFGAILITGPTGSGKSTTLAAMLKRMNTEDINIVTLEDPIEYFVDGVNQSQVHEEIGYTFAEGLRHILRQDPDVVMVGEIRDKETAGLAVQAALTGHIVLSTLHTNDAVGVVPRLIDMGIEKYLIPSTLNVAGAQRLLRRLCPDCKLQVEANSAEFKIIDTALHDMPEEYQKQYLAKAYTIHKPNTENPCKTCGGKAFKGRISICETLEMTPEFEKIILGTLSESAMRAEAKRQGMITMFQDGILKVLQGVVSLEELLEVAQAGDSA